MPLEYTSATPKDRQELGRFLDAAFSSDGSPPFLFLEKLPHLFTEIRIGEHAIAKREGKIVGCVGGYRFDLMTHGVTFDTCGIGQVATAPAERGNGVMKKLMEVTLLKNADCDFFWLYGDRRRYSHYGFELGGRFTEYTYSKRDLKHLLTPCLPKTSESTDPKRIASLLGTSFPHLLLTPSEQEHAFHGKSLKLIHSGQAQLLYSATDQAIHYARGETSPLAALFTYLIDEYRPDDEIQHHFSEIAPQSRHPLLAHYSDAVIKTSANFRIGNLNTLLPKIAPSTQIPSKDSEAAFRNKLAAATPLEASAALFSPLPSPLFPEQMRQRSLSKLHIPRIFAL